MRRRKIHIVYRNCPRCGKQVAGLNKPIFGSKAAHQKYAGLCSDCTTKEEKQEILNDQVKGLLQKSSK